ncbi:MAG: hypothetical protein ACYS8Z_07615 [Planctomycetota bacterium]|jgi:hypothetical protein
MARNRRGKLALYEVMSKAKDKPGYKRTLDKIRAGKESEEEPTKENEEIVATETAVEEDAPQVSDAQAPAPEEQEAVDDAVMAVQWRRKPRVVQYNNGRVEFSVPYQIGIAAVLGLIVVMLLAFRAGQQSVVVNKVGPSSPPAVLGGGRQDPVVTGNQGSNEAVKTVKETAKGDGNAGAVTSTGGQVIVLVEYHTTRDLGPVRDHFARYGIATEIVPRGGQYFLVTQAKYKAASFSSGGDGYLARQRIVEVGAQYKGKAPQGYESFAPHYFSDAYPKKVN